MTITHCINCRHHIHHLIAGNYGVVLCRYRKGEVSPLSVGWSLEEKDYFITCPLNTSGNVR